MKKAVYDNSERIYILSKTGEFDNNINKSYYYITWRKPKRVFISV